MAMLQLRGDVVLDSVIVRLADVAAPVGQAPAGWERAAAAAVGLLPTDGRRLRIERQRLSEMLYRSGLLGERVRWSGPETVTLRYAEPVGKTFAGRVRPVAAVGPVVAAGLAADAAPLAPAERNRIRRMIEVAFEQTYERLDERYEFTVDHRQANFAALDGLRAIRSLQLADEPTSGKPGGQTLAMIIRGETEFERVEATLRIELVELPLAVVAGRTLTRGDIIADGDVRLEPVARERFHDSLIRDLESVVGMEVKRSISEGRLMDLDDVTAPLVIRRGDLVELRVVGGGVTVTTAARALDSAAAGEPVSVETQSPRRKLFGHAVAHGVVEIVTRPPATANPGQ